MLIKCKNFKKKKIPTLVIRHLLTELHTDGQELADDFLMSLLAGDGEGRLAVLVGHVHVLGEPGHNRYNDH